MRFLLLLVIFSSSLVLVQDPTEGDPVLGSSGHSYPRRLSDELVESFSFLTASRPFRIYGIYREGGDGLQLGSDALERKTSYWPTAAGWLADDRIGVAGRTAQGRTVVEVWRITPPVLVFGLFPNGGEGVVKVERPELREVDSIYDGDLPSQGMVSAILPIAGTDDVLIQFRNTADVVRLRVGTGEEPELVVDASDAPSPDAQFHAPGAIAAREVFWGDHPAHGHVYVLDGSLPGAPKLALVDANRDGEFEDLFATDDMESWVAEGYGALDAYVHLETDHLVD